MKQLIVILGVVLLSSTETLAADMNLKDGARRTLETLPGSSPTEVTSLNAGEGSNPFALEGNANSVQLRRQHLIEVAYDQGDGRGTPGKGRGAGGQ